MKEEKQDKREMDYPMIIVIMITEIVIMGIAFFIGYTHKSHTKCEGGREVIKETTVNLDRDENKPVGTRYTLLCKDTGEIKTREDF